MDQNNETFSADYVKQLREEAASWRTKLREQEDRTKALEAQFKQQENVLSLKAEMAKMGINADPKWVEIKEGESPTDALNRFTEQYPQFKQQQDEQPLPRQPEIPSPIGRSNSNSNSPRRVLNTMSVNEIKKDPVSRAKVRDLYREMLSRQGFNHNY